MNIVPIQTGADQVQEQAPTFDDFWLLYPRRVARKDAARAWSKLTDADRVEALVALVQWRRYWIARDELQFVPHPATWLNGERWTDELPACALPTHASHVAASATPAPARTTIPEHVRAALAKLRGGK